MMKVSVAFGAASALAASVVLFAAVAAQSPAPSAVAGDITTIPHPAHIHTGTCADLGDIVAPLGDVTLVSGSNRVGTSTTKIGLSLKDILGSPHAIMTHASAADLGTYIACADLVGGDKKQLTVALDEQNESGYAGIAFLRKDNRKTIVELSLTAPEGGFTPTGPTGSVPPASIAPASPAASTAPASPAA
jgi:hypothetical protein